MTVVRSAICRLRQGGESTAGEWSLCLRVKVGAAVWKAMPRCAQDF